jgi:transcriptional regulator with XRE-family HTH domain
MRLVALRQCRLERGLEQSELARRTGIESLRLARIESGMEEPAAEEINRISAILRIPAHRLYDAEAKASLSARF